MLVPKRKLYIVALFLAVFFTFSGYYVLLILVTNLAGNQYSRYITMPIRIIINLLLFACLFLIGKKKFFDEPVMDPVFWAFFLFSFFYILRLMVEMIKGSHYSISNVSFLLYYLSFAVFPFCLLLIKQPYNFDHKLYKSAILISGTLFSLLSIVFYKDYIGKVGRINLVLSRSSDDYISPLHLSNTSALSIGVALFILFTNSTTKFHKLLLISIILISCIPFFLGAGRSSIFAILIPFIMFMFLQKNKIRSFYIFACLTVFSFLIAYLSELFGSSVIERFLSIEEGMEKGSSAAVRTIIWKYSLNHFYDNPLFGYGLEVSETDHHSHNIFLEVLLSTGILGFLPFLYLIVKAFKSSITIIRYNPKDFWIVIVFIQSLMMVFFHGTIYNGSWFWFSLGYILSLRSYQPNYLPKSTNKKLAIR